ncbi:helix-turn-helix transcriptional regulator [Methylobacterium fujisawaense]|uniref:helix-turn-helix transcriptional regulator n=1 Tax=Methylobacterium fujisawaense TaxID=107400 RepID=UPI003CFA24E4
MSEMAEIRKLVFGKRLTQAEFGRLAGVSQSTVSRWENGALNPTRDQMAAIRQAAFDRKIPWSDSWFFYEPSLRFRSPEEARP